MRISLFIRVFTPISFFIISVFPKFVFSQQEYTLHGIENYVYTEHVSTIAYKLPFRGENYKFYGTLSYHIYGKAFASCKVHNTIVEALQVCKNSNSPAYYKILRSSGKRNGKIVPLHTRKNGQYVVFMTPQIKKNKALKFYYRTGLFRKFISFEKTGISRSNEDIQIDFENTALLIVQLDKAADMYGLKINKIVMNRYFHDDLYATSFGEEILRREIYFPKYLSDKMNRKYDDLFYVEFGAK